MRRPIALPLTLLALSAAPALAGPVTVVYASADHAPTDPKSAIPGAGSIPGGGIPADPRFLNFSNKMFRSPTSNQWMAVPTTNLTPTSADQVMLLGSGLSAVVVAREGVTSPITGEFINFSLLSVPRINDSGQWAMGYRIAGGGTADERLVKWDGSAFSLALKGGDAISGLPASTYAGSFNGANISNSGNVGFIAAIAPSAVAVRSAFAAGGATVLAQNSTTTPSGQSAAIPTAVTDITSNSLYQDASGTHFIYQGKVGSDTTIDVVVVVDNAVVIQKGSTIAGMSPASPVSSIADVWMESNGDWFARGANVDATAWVVRNGVVIAQTGKPIVPGSSENWESFRSVRGNNSGHYVVSGNTTNPDTLVDDVVVLNGARVLARESDPVDITGLYVHLIQNNDAFNNDGYFYFASRLKDSPTATAGVGGSTRGSLLRVAACGADADGDGVITPSDIATYVNLWLQSLSLGILAGDYDHNNVVEPADIATYVNAWFAALSGPCI